MRSSQRRSLDLVSRDSLLGPVVLVIGACLRTRRPRPVRVATDRRLGAGMAAAARIAAALAAAPACRNPAFTLSLRPFIGAT